LIFGWSFSDWLNKRKEKRRVKAVLRCKKRIKSRFGQGEDRQQAIHFFRELGGKQA